MNESGIEKRIHRIIQILLHIDSGPRYNAKLLAEIFGVGRRTIYRDIGVLKSVGFAIVFDESAEAYKLISSKRPAYRTDLNNDDLEILSVAVKIALPAFDPSNAQRAESALARLLSGFDVAVRMQVNQLLRSLHYECTTTPPPNNLDVWSAFVQAIRNRVQVRIVYNSGTQSIQTKVSPYQLIAAKEGWRVEGRSSLHRTSESFWLTGIVEAEVTEDSFEAPRGAHRR